MACNLARRALMRLSCTAILLGASLGQAAAQGWPEQNVRYIVPFPPGGATDIISRHITGELQAGLGQSIVVENVAGASGTIGMHRLSRAPADGYTIGLGNSGTLTMTPFLQSVPYDPLDSFTPISMLTEYSNVLVVRSGFGVDTLEQFIEKASNADKPLTYASAGNGSSNHMTGVLLGAKTGKSFLHIPYKGSGPALMAVVGGEVDWMFATIAEIRPFLASGHLKALGVSTRAADPLLPSVPPINDVVKDFEVVGFMGIFGPKGIPDAVADKLNANVNAVLKNPAVVEKFAQAGMLAKSSSRDELAARVAKDARLWQQTIAQTNLPIQ